MAAGQTPGSDSGVAANSTRGESRTIYEFREGVGDPITLDLPGDAVLLAVADQLGVGQTLDFWAIVPPGPEYRDEVMRQRVIRVFGTGVAIEPGELRGFGHFDTVVTAGGALVWHVFLDFDGARSIPEGS